MVVLVVTSAAPRAKLEKVANAMAKHPAVRGLVAITNDRRDGAIVPSGSAARVLIGHGHLVETIAGVPIEVGASEFLQVNRAQAAAMYARVAELAAGAKHAVDLFAGLGGIGLHLARAGTAVVAVEIDRDAVAQLRRAAEAAELPLTALAGDAGDIAAEVRAQLGERPDVVVVNPPRKGLAGALQLVVDLAPPTVIYVSCGPESLGRDLAALATHGYRARRDRAVRSDAGHRAGRDRRAARAALEQAVRRHRRRVAEDRADLEQLAVPVAQRVGVAQVAVLVLGLVRGAVEEPPAVGVVEVGVAAFDERLRLAFELGRALVVRLRRRRCRRGDRRPPDRPRRRTARAADRSRGRREARAPTANRACRARRAGSGAGRARRHTRRVARARSSVKPAVSPLATRSSNVIRSGCEMMLPARPRSIEASRLARYGASASPIKYVC